MSKKQSTSQSPSTEDTLDNSEQDEIHQAAAVICDALGSFEDRQMSSPRGRGRGSERRSSSENLSVKIARAFFQAATVKSGDDEDILPQEDGPDEKLSVYYLFSELFPDHVNNMVCSEGGSKNGLTRLQFNKIGYEIYFKEQSRRVPAPRAKPGNPGYGFKHARWRSPYSGEDSKVCQQTLKPFVTDPSQMKHIIRRVEDFRSTWDACRRPSHPAGPGRGRKTSSNVIAERKRAFEQVRPLHEARASLAFSTVEAAAGAERRFVMADSPWGYLSEGHTEGTPLQKKQVKEEGEHASDAGLKQQKKPMTGGSPLLAMARPSSARCEVQAEAVVACSAHDILHNQDHLQSAGLQVCDIPQVACGMSHGAGLLLGLKGSLKGKDERVYKNVEDMRKASASCFS